MLKKINLQNNQLDSHYILKNLLASSNDFQYFELLINENDAKVDPVILEESMFLLNKDLEVINIVMPIEEIKV